MAIEDTGRPVDEYHSRFDEEHYKNCQDCYEAHLDFMMECEMDARLDAMSEMEEYGEEEGYEEQSVDTRGASRGTTV